MPRRNHLYVGRAGQMAVMAEFLLRGYNVAVPEVDVGDDIFVVRDSDGEFSRIQVKTTLVTETRDGYSARYTIRRDQLITLSAPELWYVFANRSESRWQSFLVVPRPELASSYSQHKLGSQNQQGVLSLYVTFSGPQVTCFGQDFSHYLNNWGIWPYLQHDI
jgi:hypothetical protein